MVATLERTRYVAFRLPDIPDEKRVRAAQAVSETLVRELRRDLLDGPVAQRARYVALFEATEAMREAIRPRGSRVFQVPVESWDKLIGTEPPGGNGVGA